MSGDINTTINKFRNLLASVGKADIHSLFPNDFEYYSCALELCNHADEIVDMLIFPIMPNSIRESNQPSVNVKKTSSAVVSLFTPSFIPFPIQLSGTFGKKFRFLLGNKTDMLVSGVNLYDEQFKTTEFSVQVKTGYGCIKIMERIVKKSTSLDSENRPYKLYFYNMAFNSNHLVEVTNFSFEQSMRNNMMWDYNLSLEAIAPAYNIRQDKKSSLSNLLKYDNLQKAQNIVFDDTLENLYKTRAKIFK